MWIVLLVLLLLLVVIWKLFRTESFTSMNTSMDSIFVSIASYRDEECSASVEEIYSKADNPERIFCGICEQNKQGASNESCTRAPMSAKYQANIRKDVLDYTQAKGPTFARYKCSKLYQNETFFLQIDSHSKFKQGWDTRLIEQWNELHTTYNVSKPVLSTYPASWDNKNDDEVPVLCKSSFNDDKVLTFLSILKKPSKDGSYYKTPFTSGGFLFMKGLGVQFDPNLPHLFTGEELCYSARLFTHGYDVYTPKTNVVYHHYVRSGKPKFWEDIKDYRQTQQDSIAKVKYILKMSTEQPPEYLMQDIEVYGLGSERTIEEYYAFAGLDITNQKSTSGDKFC